MLITIETLLLVLEDALSREDFRQDLLQSIVESRQDFNDRIGAAMTAAIPENTPLERGLLNEDEGTQLTP